MVVSSLYKYYETLLNDEVSGISKPGFSRARVGYCLVLSRDGRLLDVIDLRIKRNEKMVLREINVPEQGIRTSGVSANFMCDNSTYILGLRQKNKKEKKRELKNASKLSSIDMWKYLQVLMT